MPFNALVIDDDLRHSNRVKGILASLGAEVTVKHEQLTGLGALQAGRFDLVLLQTDIPNADGMRTGSLIKSVRTVTAQAPIIGIGPSTAGTAVRDHTAAGFWTLFQRPVEPWRLRNAIHTLGLSPWPALDEVTSLKILHALSSPVRFQLFSKIAHEGEVSATALAKLLGEERRALSHHLKLLEGAGLLSTRQAGKEARFFARPVPVETAAYWMLEVASRIGSGPSPS